MKPWRDRGYRPGSALLTQLIENFVTLFVVIDPIGSVPILLMATPGLRARERGRVVLLAVLTALLVLLLFLYFGQYLLEAMHIGIPAFKLAGGSVLFIFAVRMIFAGHASGAAVDEKRSLGEIAVFPVALPGIASPGALLAVVLLTDNARFSLLEESITAGLTFAVLLCVLVILLLAARIQRLLGNAGIIVVSQIMGLVLAAFSAQQILDGLREALGRIAS
jgi:multiple antibiotic resistance protein